MNGLFVASLSGPQWLSGGEFGAEASAVAVVLCSALGLAMLRLAHRRGHFIAPFWRRGGSDRTARPTARSPATSDRAAAPSGP
jgi:hypothetical protein